MKILVTGANGFVGQHLTVFLSGKKHNIFAAGRGECRIPFKNNFEFISADFTEKKNIEELLTSINPDIIIHAAAMSKPDECENEKEKCLLHNVTATKNLLSAFGAKGENKKFIFISTDFVFGENGPHDENAEPCPLNFYGKSKLLAEQEVINSNVDYAIVRPVFVYGESWQGLRPTFLHWVKNNLEKGNTIKVVSDQKRTPTFVNDLCKGIESIVNVNRNECWHFAGKDILSPFEMAETVAKVLKLDASLIEKVTSETFKEPVKRAKYSGLIINKAINETDYNPVSFEEGVKLTFGIL